VKTASLPSLRVDPELRQAAESVLLDGESLSSFMESSLRESVNRRQMQRDFVARGLQSRDEARRTGEYYDAADVHAELEAMLVAAEKSQENR
jgi:predicted transcriptional regulator